MLTNRIRSQFDGKTREQLEQFLVAQYPLGELIERYNMLLFDTGVPQANGQPNLEIRTGMYCEQVDGQAVVCKCQHVKI
jgi:hypothetical protein